MAFVTEDDSFQRRQQALQNQALENIIGGFENMDAKKRRDALEAKRDDIAKKKRAFDFAGMGIDPNASDEEAQSILQERATDRYAAEAAERKYQESQRTLPFDQTREGQIFASKSQMKADADAKAFSIKQQADKDKEQRKLERETKKMADPAYRLQKAGGETKKAVGGVASAYRALNQIGDAMAFGESPEYIDANTPVIGLLKSDTPISKAQRVLSEVVGRLQSGGAINKDEEARFLAMGPRPGDNKLVAAQKLQDQRAFLDNKLSGFGFKRDELKRLNFNLGDDAKFNEFVAKTTQPQSTPLDLMPAGSGVLMNDAVAAPVPPVQQTMDQFLPQIKQMSREDKLRYMQEN